LNCASCHGLNGQGVDAPALNSKEFLQSVDDKQIHYITAAGIPGTEMPTWWNELGGPLTDEQIAAIVAYVRSWEKSAPSRPDWRHPRGS
jgi:cytochrome c oxidase cbb3-type subunit 3